MRKPPNNEDTFSVVIYYIIYITFFLAMPRKLLNPSLVRNPLFSRSYSFSSFKFDPEFLYFGWVC